MHWIDVLIVVVIAAATFQAFRAGLIREVAALLGVVLGAFLAGQLYDELADDLAFAIDDPRTRNLVSFVAIFAGVVVIAQMIAFLLRGAAAVLFLGPLDHLGGAVFGFVKGLLLVAVLIVAANRYPAASGIAAALEQSAIAPLFLERIEAAQRLLPAEFDLDPDEPAPVALEVRARPPDVLGAIG